MATIWANPAVYPAKSAGFEPISLSSGEQTQVFGAGDEKSLALLLCPRL
jgi:hypothetical protein